MYPVEMDIQDDKGASMKRDGKSPGRLVVRGPTIAGSYYNIGEEPRGPDDYFDTGDIATVDRYGYMEITDRAKDIIKSGREAKGFLC